jgi:hypothetical protein
VAEPIRVGDRYLRGDDEHITITAVDVISGEVTYSTLRPGYRTGWVKSGTLPLPDAWVKTGSGPIPKDELCLACEKYPHEAGQYFCTDCLLTQAANWAGLDAAEVAERVEALKIIQGMVGDDE